MTDKLVFGDKSFDSRLIVGSSMYPNQQVMMDSIAASGAEVVTVAMRRINVDGGGENVIDMLADKYTILPNTAGCYTARDAVLTAQLAREALETDWIKLEVIGDDEILYPDVEHLLDAADQLVQDGFSVLAYTSDDPITCKKLEDIGCTAVMPLGAPIGSGMGLRNPYNLEIIRDLISVPLIVDAGIGTASDAAMAMELGYDGVMVASAIARAHDPVAMAAAIGKGVEAGRLAYKGGRIPRKLYAEASSPKKGVVGS